MNTDSYFKQGFGHTVCQDYALNGENKDIAFALVTDGCSSSEKTDVGARLLAEAFLRSAAEIYSPNYNLLGAPNPMIQVDVVGRLIAIKSLLTLPSNAFDATLLAAVYDKKANELGLFIWGDGFVRLDYAGKHENWKISYPKNAPCYLSYRLNDTRMKAYQTEFPDNEANLYQHIQFTPSKEGGLALCGQEQSTLEPFHFRRVSLEGLKTITVMSDGLETFSKVGDDGETRPVDYGTMFDEAVSFKNHAGNFVQRRMLALAKNSAKLNRSHYDDVSVASISFV